MFTEIMTPQRDRMFLPLHLNPFSTPASSVPRRQ